MTNTMRLGIAILLAGVGGLVVVNETRRTGNEQVALMLGTLVLWAIGITLIVIALRNPSPAVPSGTLPAARSLANEVGEGELAPAIAKAYPDLPADVLSGAPLKRALFCRTFSDCTTGPRMGLVSGCYPLDRFYAGRPEAIQIRNVRTHVTDT